MIDRLRLLMDYYSLSSSQLAEAIGVPRSSISHLLTGRNKPSLDFILKLIKEYPDVNLYWLLNGKGSFPPIKDEIQKITPAPENTKETQQEIESELKQLKIDDFANNIKEHKIVSEELDRIVFFYKDGTFKTFSPK